MYPGMKKYSLQVCIYHDSDFGSRHPFFDKSDSRDLYIDGRLGWNTREVAIRMATKVLKEIRDTMDCKDWIQDVFEEKFNEAIRGIQEDGFCDVYLGGNYEGTFIRFNANW